MPAEQLLAPPGIYLLGLGAAFSVSLLLAVAVAMLRNGARSRLRARVDEIARDQRMSRTAGFAAGDGSQKRQRKARLKELAAGNKRREVIRSMIEQAGLSWTVGRFYIVSVICAVAASGVYWLVDLPGWGLFFAPVAGGLLLPRVHLRRTAAGRQRKFTAQLADAIDIIVRGIRSGLPVGECLEIIARESPEPVASEFRAIVEGQRLGLSLKEIMAKAAARMPTADMRFFAVVLVLQQKTGGNLAEALANLSSILRARKKMADKVRAMSAEARMTAMIIGSLPFILGGIIYLFNPAYIQLLFTDPAGKKMSLAGLAWMCVGIFTMKQMISFKI
jgi:tight adherence protein B